MASFMYTVFSMAQVASLHCSVRREISPCTCAPHEFSADTIVVNCEGVGSFNQVFDALQNKLNPDLNIWLKITHSQLEDLETRTFDVMNIKIKNLRLNYNQLRNLHIAPLRPNSRLLRSHNVLAAVSLRHISELPNNQTADADLFNALPRIPEPPPVPSVELTNTVTELAPGVEPAFETLGLGGYTPVGLIQSAMEYLHVVQDLPWWAVIMCGTIAVRTLIFPLVILSQRNSAKMGNNMPQMQVLQLKMSAARSTGNQFESARLAQEMVQFMKEKDLSPFRSMLVPLAQAPLYISFFMGLRQMANAPVESMREGTDAARLSQQSTQTLKYVLRAMPIVIFSFTINFPGAILCYWACSNFISLIQVGFLRIPAVRDFFKIERAIDDKPEKLAIKPKPFVQGFKDSLTNMKISRELAERERIDSIQFQRAGSGPLVKTYKFDPTKVQKMPTILISTTVKK